MMLLNEKLKLIDFKLNFVGAATNKAYVEDYLRPCRWRLPQQVSLVCFREGSDEIIGLNVNGVSVKNEPFGEMVARAVLNFILYVV